MASIILSEVRGSKTDSILENDEDNDDEDFDEGQTGPITLDGAPNGFHHPTPEIRMKPPYDNLRNRPEISLTNGQLDMDGAITASADTLSKTGLAKSAAIKRREYGISLLLSNVPMSPKIVNGSFAAMFDDATTSISLDGLCRQLTVGGEFIRLSPRKRSVLGDNDRQMSLDYGVLTASRKQCPMRKKLMGSLDSKIDDILELGSTSSEHDSGKNSGEQEGDTISDVTPQDDSQTVDDAALPTESIQAKSPSSGHEVKRVGFQIDHSANEVNDDNIMKDRACVEITPTTQKSFSGLVSKGTSVDRSLTSEVGDYCPLCGRGAGGMKREC